MTGYAHVARTLGHLRASVEIKSLNSKQHAEVAMRLPHDLRTYELPWRKRVLSCMIRGKLTVVIEYEHTAPPALPSVVEAPIFRQRYAELLALARDVGASTQPLVSDALRLPGVVKSASTPEGLQQADVEAIQALLEEALHLCQAHRKQEGAAVQGVLETHVKSLRTSLAKICALAPQRLERIENKLRRRLASVVPDECFEPTRLAQELLLYADRLDISEETERTEAHLNFFEEMMRGENGAVGKQLGFIAQELVREINTMAAKAHHAAIQKETICMKEVVERLKEQLYNVL